MQNYELNELQYQNIIDKMITQKKKKNWSLKMNFIEREREKDNKLASKYTGGVLLQAYIINGS